MLQYVPYVFYALLAIGAIAILLRRSRIKRSGTETDAVVSRIDRQESRSDDGSTHTSVYYYARFVDDERQTREARLMSPPKGLKEGTRLRIRYLPDKPKTAVVTEVLGPGEQ